MDYILNGQAQGSVAATLLNNGFNVAALRPWVGQDGRHYVTHNVGGKNVAAPLINANATLRKDEWKLIDDAVAVAAKQRMNIVSDLRGAGLTFNVPNGMGTTVLESQRIGDITGATISMDPARKSEGDRPEFDIYNLPLPVIHKDFFFNARQIAVSRSRGASIDTITAQLAARKVMEEAEKLALGTVPAYEYAGANVYGLTNFPSRLTKLLTSPEASDWTPATLIREVLDMRQKSTDLFYYGPFALYFSPAWDPFLDEDYSSLKGENTLRQRIESLNSISSVRTAYFLSGYQVLMVQMTSDVIREVIGMDITTLQWETDGGMRIHFKVMAIMVPQLRADINGSTGIVHGSAVSGDISSGVA